MTVAEYIAKLQELPQDAPIFRDDDGRFEACAGPWEIEQWLTTDGNPCHKSYPGARRVNTVLLD